MATKPSEASLPEVRRALQSFNARLAALESEVFVAAAAAATATARLDNWSFGPLQDHEGNAILDSDDAEILSNGDIEQWLDRLASIVEGPILDSNDEPITDWADSAMGVSDWYTTPAAADATADAVLPATFSTAIT